MWSIFSIIAGVLLMMGSGGQVRIFVLVSKQKGDLELMERSKASLKRKDLYYSLSGEWAHRLDYRSPTRDDCRLNLSPSKVDKVP